MKLNNKKTGIACMIGVAVLASSCSDWLDPKPLSFYTPEISFTDYNGLKTGTDMLNRDVRYFEFYGPLYPFRIFLFGYKCQRTY